MKNSPWPIRWLCLLLVILALLGGCGKKTRPVPPAGTMPAPISDLRHELGEQGVTLIWSAPKRTEGGGKLPYRIKDYEIFRAVVSAAEYAPDQPVTFGPPLTIASEPDERGRMTYQEALLRPQHRYIYQVRSRAGWLVTSAPSNRVAVFWDTLPLPPVDLGITPGDRTLTLAWQAAEETGREGEPLAWQVYRSTDGENFSPLGQPQSATSLVDQPVENDRTYYYQIRTLRGAGDARISGLPSRIISGSARDLTPPAPPRLVAAVRVQEGEGIRILWEASPDQDVAAYRIYRRPAGAKESARIGETVASALSFIDSAPPTGIAVWHYTVTAVDKSGNESAAPAAISFESTR